MTHQPHDCECIGAGFAESRAKGMTERVEYEIRRQVQCLPDAFLLLAEQGSL
jgi:hypothetical protein